MNITIREFEDDDSIAEVTHLLHRAYAPLAERGFRFLASYQDEDTTVRRIISGKCFIALDEGKIIGTINCYAPDANRSDWPPTYKENGVAHFGQFAIEPAYQNEGLGSRLLFQAEEQAIVDGMHTMSFDTAEEVPELILYYEKKGYKAVEFHQWHSINYRSVILAKKLTKR